MGERIQQIAPAEAGAFNASGKRVRRRAVPSIIDMSSEDITVRIDGTVGNRRRGLSSITDLSEQAEGAQVFVENREGGREFVFVPLDVKRAGELLQQARQIHDVSVAEIARTVNLGGRTANTAYLENFEAGAIPDPELRRILIATEKFIDPEDERMRALKEIINEREQENKWLRTLTRPNLTLGQSVMYIRTSFGLSRPNFAKIAGLSAEGILNLEREKNSPHPATIEQVIKASKLNPERKAAQLLRLRAAGKDPLTLDELEKYSFGDLVKYLRVLRGLTQEQLGDALGYVGGSNFVENQLQSISKKSLDKLIVWLDLGPDSALAKIVRQKKKDPNEPISAEMLTQVLAERYLFANIFRK